MTPRMEALAFRIWAYANTIGWDATISEVAEAVGTNWRVVSVIATHKRWHNRFRATRPHDHRDSLRYHLDIEGLEAAISDIINA